MYKTLVDKKKAVLFDLDGTVIQSNSLWKKAFENVALNFTIFVTMDFPTGLPIQEKWERLLKNEQPRKDITVMELTKQTNNEFIKLQETEKPQITDGFWELGKELKIDKKLKLGLTTNSPRNVVDAVIKTAELGNVFDVIVTSDDVKNPKPSADIYNRALKNLKMRPRDVLAFEDSIAGVQAALAAGIDTCVVWDTTVPRSHYPTSVVGFIEDFTTLPGNLDKTKYDYYKELGDSILTWWNKHKLSEKLETVNKSQ